MAIENHVSEKAKQHFYRAIEASKYRAFDVAEQEYREAINIDPNFAEAHYNLGLLLINSKRFEEAEKEFLEVVRIRPDARAYGNLGILYFETGKKEKAKEALLKAKELFEKQKNFKESKICEEYLARLME